MARVEHFKRKDVRRLCNEWERVKNKDGSWKFTPTGKIDPTRTHLNYAMVPGVSAAGALASRLASPGLRVDKRKSTNVISSWAITCPEELKGEPKKVKQFFELSWKFLKDRYGPENCLQGYVHMDETSPHMHAIICPVADGRVSAKALFTRTELREFHRALDAKCAEEPPDGFGMKGLVLNGRTKGGYTTAELRERTAKEEEIEARTGAVSVRETKVSYEGAAVKAREKAVKRREGVLEQKEVELRAERQKAVDEAQRAAERQERERVALNERRRQLEEWESELDERSKAQQEREKELRAREAVVSRKEAVLTAMGRERYERGLREAQAARTEQRSAEAALLAPTDAPRRGKRAGKIPRENPSV